MDYVSLKLSHLRYNDEPDKNGNLDRMAETLSRYAVHLVPHGRGKVTNGTLGI